MRKNPNYEMNQIEGHYQETNPQINTRNRTNIQINNQIIYPNSNWFYRDPKPILLKLFFDRGHLVFALAKIKAIENTC